MNINDLNPNQYQVVSSPQLNVNNLPQGSYSKVNLPPSPLQEQQSPGFFGQIGQAFQGGIQQAKEGYSQAYNAQNPLQLLEGGTKLAAGAFNAAFSPAAPIFNPVSQGINKSADLIGSNPSVQKFAMSPAGQATARGAEDIGNLATVAQGVAGGMQAKEILPSLAESAKNNIQGGVEAIKASREAKAVAQENSKITDTISPKPTAKEARLAQSEGRFVEGRKPTLLRSGTEDTILPSKKTISASQTIQKNIPGASKMTPSDLYKAVDKNITDTATKLRPQMDATPIRPETIEKINTDWQALKKQQMADAPATEEANVLKRQNKFESLLQKSGAQNHGDLWDTAIKYDNSIPDSVKKANSMSPESLQLQKQEWLDNRQILSDAMGKSDIPEFKQMSDMYEAKNNLLSKTSVQDAAPSKLKQWIKDNPKKATAMAGLLGVEGAKILGFDIRDLIP